MIADEHRTLKSKNIISPGINKYDVEIMKIHLDNKDMDRTQQSYQQ